MASSLADILLRRTMIAYGPHAGIGPDERILEVAGKEITWTRPQQKKELAAFREWIERYRPLSGRKVRSTDRAHPGAGPELKAGGDAAGRITSWRPNPQNRTRPVPVGADPWP